ncbi:PIN domain-containing protein (plasmid) [Agrobacterium radiobacter]|uniref:Putative plasmid stabilization protein n=1 Tax=Agrobacterium tumefaciens str. B6 TaxID=1183423 RepID=A0A822VDE0_AGRTU|nr:PIN domain-containing protein [Agrobacterium tumefaciens]KWT87342.1 recombinase [Agrobacterium tumefaciens str. B6]MQB27671.1 type II toxin-antitoxin system VapC family toxin [Agrobacterium tumefaciens]NTA08501.1 type II toxin-antitoxin system VapC family toxin [Agrobacterium tumefaciens]NTA94681.1 type II toxin-antitoxin system VapC family toxin [Agrobacterium tumefaciens]NTB15988.1 type II toxin-antitoxin system VapC family toxin [Agrobacterium tumefaciens]
MKTDALTKASSFDFLDTNAMSETLKRAPDSSVIAWLVRHDAELALPTVAVAEIAFGIQKIRPDQRADRLEEGLVCWRRRFSDRMFAFTEEAALAYGDIMGDAARQGRGMSAPDGMIAAIARINGGRLAARNLKDFETTGLELMSPWQF